MLRILQFEVKIPLIPPVYIWLEAWTSPLLGTAFLRRSAHLPADQMFRPSRTFVSGGDHENPPGDR